MVLPNKVLLDWDLFFENATKQNISRYEKGKVVPSADRFLDLLEV
jgi:transcriptional regulator with XRE-family HTH domain